MKKSLFRNFIKEEIKRKLSEDISFPKGGNIGGQHKPSINDKDFKSNMPKGNTGSQNQVNNERYNKAVSRLFGVNWHDNKNNPMQYTFERNLEFLKDMIGYWKGRRKSSAPENYASELDNVKHILDKFPKELSIHFGIVPNSDKSIISFLDHGANSFLGNYEEYKKLPLKCNDVDETTIVDKNTDSSQASTIASDEGTDTDTVDKAISTAKTSGKPVTIA